MYRKIMSFLEAWKDSEHRKPLILQGARQVGKTETIRKFAKENYKNLVEINFITEPAYKTIIDEGFSADNILKLISRIDPSKHFDTGETLLFFEVWEENHCIWRRFSCGFVSVCVVWHFLPVPLRKPNSTDRAATAVCNSPSPGLRHGRM